MGDLRGCLIYLSKTQGPTSRNEDRNEERKLVISVLKDLLIDDMCEIWPKIDLYNL
jgi:hypothetical protein